MKKEVPEYDRVYNFLANKELGFGLGNETKKSKIGYIGEKSEHNRPHGLRIKRAEIYKKVLSTKDENEKWALFKDGHEYDKLNEQLMTKHLVEVDVDSYGLQSASYSVLDVSSEPNDNTPIFLWTGISNDPEGIGWLSIEMAKMTREKVVVMGHPQGWNGNTTKEFGDAVKEKGVDPHTSFFVKATSKLAKEMGIEKFKLVGISAGAVLVGHAIATNADFAKQVKEVGLIAPAGCVNKNETVAKIQEAPAILSNLLNLSYLSPINTHEVEISQEKRHRMLTAHRHLLKLMMTRLEWWKGIRDSGVNTTAVIFDKDRSTAGTQVINELEKEMEVVTLKGTHATPVIHPQETINALFGD